jgi:GxxExxY protein
MALRDEDLTWQIIGAAIEVHRHLGPGLLESVYQISLARELTLRNIPFRREVNIPVMYKGEPLDANFRADFIVADRVILELKAIEKLLPVHEAQLITYMKLASCSVGLLINFNVTVLKEGIIRRVL